MLLAQLNACSVAPAQNVAATVAETVAPAPAMKAATAALSAEADAALKQAEQNVSEARAQRALWIAAAQELDKARAAAKAFDSGATLLHAREASALCTLSLQQKQAPPVSW